MTGRGTGRRPVVRLSRAAPEGHLCVDLFERPDGSFGFEVWRRDPEDPRGWGGAAGHGARSFDSLDAARAAAAEVAPWLGTG